VEFGNARTRFAALVVGLSIGAAGWPAPAQAAPVSPTVIVRVEFATASAVHALPRLPLRSLARMFDRADQSRTYELRVAATDAPAVVAQLNAMPSVQWADIAPKPGPLPDAPPTPNYTSLQTYRPTAARGGVDADYANLLPGGRGENVSVADIEYNWNFAHEDLSKARASGARVTAGNEAVYYGEADHGTAVLGIVGADANPFGVTGIAPAAGLHTVNAVSDQGYSVARAIYAALEKLEPGDVVLLEQQTAGYSGACGFDQYGCVPIEWDNTVYDAIVAATAAGVIVVEAAGNGSQNLDHSRYGTSFPKGKRDSGAILVGAGNPSDCYAYGGVAERGRLPWSNFGSRVDVQGWGTCIATTGVGDLWSFANRTYTNDFGGTSGAAAMVAGAVANLSSIAEERGTRLTPALARTILRTTGAPQPPDTKRIGPLPDLRKAIAALAPPSKPSLSGPTSSVVPGATIASTVPTVVQWAGQDPGGVSEYRVWKSIAGGAYTPVALPSPTTRSMKFNLAPRQRYAFAVMARNNAGTWGDIKLTVVTPRVMQENDAAVRYGSGWHRVLHPSSSGGYTEQTTANRTTATITFTGTQLTLVATRGTSRGAIEILIDGHLKELVSLAGTSQRARAFRTYRWATNGRHQLTVRSPGDAKLVDLDAFTTA
jgi:hypothetical protein